MNQLFKKTICHILAPALVVGTLCLLPACGEKDEPLPGGPVKHEYVAPDLTGKVAPELYDGPRGTDIPFVVAAGFSLDTWPDGWISPTEARRLIAENVSPETIYPLGENNYFEYWFSGASDHPDGGYYISFIEISDTASIGIEDYVVTGKGEIYTTNYERGFPEYDFIWVPDTDLIVSEPKDEGPNPGGALIPNEDAAGSYLLDALAAEGETTEGTAVLFEEEETWESGEKAWYYAWGANTPEKFTAEMRFAVTENGDIGKYSIVEDNYSTLFHSLSRGSEEAVTPQIQEVLDLAARTSLTCGESTMDGGNFTDAFYALYLYGYINSSLSGWDSRISDTWDERGYAISAADFLDMAAECFDVQPLPEGIVMSHNGFEYSPDKETVYFMSADGEQMNVRFVATSVGAEYNRTYVGGYIEASYSADEPYEYQCAASAALAWNGKNGAETLSWFVANLP